MSVEVPVVETPVVEAPVEGVTPAAPAAADPAAPVDWRAALPEDLRDDATLGRFKSVEELARGHTEAHKVAKSKLSIPADDAPPEAWNDMWDKLGRPADPKDYDIPVPEGGSSELADAFRPFAHKIGMPANMAKASAEFFNEQAAAKIEAHFAKGEEEIGVLKTELGSSYDAKKADAQRLYKAMGLPVEFADELDTKVGSAVLMRGFMMLADKFGDPARVDGDGDLPLGGGEGDPAAKISALFKDKGWREKFNAGDVATVEEYNRLNAAAKAKATRAK